jgi:hypothetical protein
MAENSNDHSGSRWEPDSDEHVTEDLTPAGEQPTEIIPGLGEEAPPPAPPKKRIPKAAAAIAIVAAATIGGGAIGLALAGNSSEPASDTAVTSESTAGTGQDQGTAPDGTTGAVPGFSDGDGDNDGDGYGHGPGGFGHHGPGGH